MNTPTRDTPPSRKPRTFELQGAEWVDASPKRPRAPLWLLIPAALVALSSLVLVAFAALAAVVTGGILAVRSLVRAGFAQVFRR